MEVIEKEKKGNKIGKSGDGGGGRPIFLQNFALFKWQQGDVESYQV